MFCSHRKRIQNCTLTPNAVKIFITDCPPCVKRNSFPSAGKALRPDRMGCESRLRRFNHVRCIQVKYFHTERSNFGYWIAADTTLLTCSPSLIVKEYHKPRGLPGG